MKNFRYHNYTEIIFGKDSENEVGIHIKKYASKILLHYGGGSIKKSGLYDRVKSALEKENIEVIELGGVKPNPRLSLVKEGIKLCKEHNIDFILAVGGGSVIDSSKAIAIGANYDGDVWDFFMGKKIEHEPLKLGVILTIPAAGSESSVSCVITNEETLIKKGVNSPLIRPMFAIMNPELTFTLPKYQTACGIVDMFCHILERYFTNELHVDVTDGLCEGLMKAIIKNAERILKEPNNYEIRAEIMLAGLIAHNGSLDLGRVGDWASHNMEHELSAIYDIAHGAGLAITTPAWAKYVYKHNIPRFVRFANQVFNVEVNPFNLEETALKGIEELEKFFRSLDLPTRLSEVSEIKADDELFKLMAQKIVETYGTIGRFVTLEFDDIVSIYRLAK
ncbi:TPA: iron-containing alcohol dehydrogenase [bacterium]|jgi:alcohol dehydrogenase YqhD (iron-dependent ADH family)|nr:iron-containing alcohol dehydrogenase [bacterium]